MKKKVKKMEVSLWRFDKTPQNNFEDCAKWLIMKRDLDCVFSREIGDFL